MARVLLASQCLSKRFKHAKGKPALSVMANCPASDVMAELMRKYALDRNARQGRKIIKSCVYLVKYSDAQRDWRAHRAELSLRGDEYVLKGDRLIAFVLPDPYNPTVEYQQAFDPITRTMKN